MRLRNYSAILSDASALVCFAPNGYHLSLVGGFIVETDGTANHCDLEIYDGSDNLKATIPFPLTSTANNSVSIDSKIFLDQNEYLKAVLDTGTGAITVFGAETVKDTENIPDAWTWMGAWDSAENYAANNLVFSDGSCYIAINPNNNDEPPSANWTVFAGGISHVERTSGDGSPGTTDTYTIYQDPGTANPIGTFDVYNGSGLSAVVDDTSPEFGGDLNGGGFKQFNTILNSQVLGQVDTDQTLDCSAYNEFSFEPIADIVLNFTNIVAGTIVSVRMTGGGDQTLTWQAGGIDTGWKWAGGAEPDWSTDTGIDVAVLIGNDADSLDAGLSLEAVG